MKNVYFLVNVFVLLTVISVLQCKANEEISCDNIQITVDIQADTIAVTVNPTFCTVVYFLTHFVNCYPIANRTLPQPAGSTFFARHPNSRNRIIMRLTATGDVAASTNFVDGVVGSSAVQNLRFNEENDLFEWDKPEELEECELQYKINLSNEIHADETITGYQYFTIPPHSCVKNAITITTLIPDWDIPPDDIASITQDISLRGERAVQNIKFIQERGRFEWDAPEDSSRCDMKYSISFNNEIESDQVEMITQQYYGFDIYSCTNNNITVTTLIGFDNTNGEDASATYRISLVNSAVQRLQFIEDRGRFEWDAPEDSSRCDITYRIRFNNAIGFDEVDETTDKFYVFDLHTCTKNQIIVNAIIGFDDTFGEDTSTTHIISVDNSAVEDLKFNEASGRFEWKTPQVSIRCEIEYQISFSNGIDFDVVKDTTDTFFEFPLYPCTHNHITVTTMLGFADIKGDDQSASHTIYLNIDDSAVQELQFSETTNRFEWLPPPYSSRCDIRYKILFANEIDTDDTRETVELFYEFPLRSCSINRITVTTMIGFNDLTGLDKSASHAISLVNSAVQRLQFIEEKEQFEWDAPEDSSRCDITYRIRFNNGIESDEVDGTTDTFYGFDLHTCTKNEITVTAIIGFDDTIGVDTSATHLISLDNSGVEDLRFNADSTRFEWMTPQDSSRCEIRYRISFSNGIESEDIPDTTDTFFEFPLYPCTHNDITVTTMIGFDDTKGDDRSARHTIYLDIDDSAVQELQFSETTNRFEWLPPPYSSRCDIRYKILFANEIDTDDTRETVELFYEFPLRSCSINRITVTTMIGFNDLTGLDKSASHAISLVNSAVQRLQFIEETGQFEWDAPEDSSRCDITYRIRFNNAIENYEVGGITDTFYGFDLHTCTKNQITVTAIIGFDDTIGVDTSTTHLISLDNSGVEDLRFNEDSTRFEWMTPQDSSRCEIRYRISFSNGIEFEDIPDTTDTFFEFPLYPCTHNDITVTTMIGFDDTKGDDRSARHTIYLNIDDSAVQELQFSETTNRFEWLPPQYSGRCDIRYRILFTNAIDMDDTRETVDQFYEFPLHSCSINRITVTTMIGFNDLTGLDKSASHVISLVNSAVQDLRFSEDKGRFEWEAPEDSGRCNIWYSIKFSNAIDSEDVQETTLLFFEFPLYQCTHNHISVTTMIGFDDTIGEVESATQTIYLNTTNSAVQDLQFSEVNKRFEWVAPQDSSRCDIQYRIRFSNLIDPEDIKVTPDPFFAFPLLSCTINHITVTTIIGFINSDGEDACSKHTIPLINSAVRDLRFIEEKGRFEWDAPEDSSRCDLKYSITFNNAIESVDGKTITDKFYAFDLYSCTNNHITVTTIIGFDNAIGKDVSTLHAISVDNKEVQNLKFNTDNNKFEWEAPDDSERCELEYTVTQYRNGNFAYEVVTTNLFHEIFPYFCTDNLVTVATRIGFDNTISDNVYSSHLISAPPVRKVQDLRFDVSQSRFYWSAPEKSEFCKLEYKVEFANDVREETVHTSEEYFVISVYPCSNNYINVTTLFGYDFIESEIVSAHHPGPMTRQLPNHIRTNPQPTSAAVTWKIRDEPFNLCEIDYLRYEVIHLDTGDETHFRTDFKEGTEIDYVLINLEVNQMYSYKLCFIFSMQDSTICSDSVTFLTEPLSKPQIATRIDEDENIEVSWIQTYYSSFISGHTVIIEPTGPNHFVPPHCFFDKIPKRIDLEANATRYILENPLPSFRYNITVITNFEELGMTTEDVDQITTREKRPDELDVNYSYTYVPKVRYDVSLAINWSIPCDINGKIQEFHYIVYKEFYNNKDAKCNDLFQSGTVTVTEDPQETYYIPHISHVLPFFRYSVEVTTYLDAHNRTTIVELEVPPQALTPTHQSKR